MQKYVKRNPDKKDSLTVEKRLYKFFNAEK